MPHTNDARFSGRGNLINNIIPQLQKENVHLYPGPPSYDDYTDVYFLSPREDVEVTVSSLKSKDVTCKTHSDLLTAQLPWLVDLAKLVSDVGWWGQW